MQQVSSSSERHSDRYSRMDGKDGFTFIDFTSDRAKSLGGSIAAGYRVAQESEQLGIQPGSYAAEVARVISVVTIDCN